MDDKEASDVEEEETFRSKGKKSSKSKKQMKDGSQRKPPATVCVCDYCYLSLKVYSE